VWRWLTPRAILWIAAAGIVLYAYPGLVSYDSVVQLDQGRHGTYGDWQPPAMAALWHAIEFLIGGPLGMLLLQIAGLVIGGYLVLREELSPRAAAIAVLAIAWFPPIVTVTGVIWKDGVMVSFMLLGLAALLSPRPRVRWFALAALLVATAVRYNAAAATFAPLVLLWGRETPRRLQRYAVAVGVWIAITVASILLNAALVTKHEHPFPRAAAPQDISGILKYAPAISDAELKDLLAGVPMRPDHDLQREIAARYEPRGSFIYFEHEAPLIEPSTPAEFDAETRAWRRLLLRYPLAFVKHRAKVLSLVVQARGAPHVPSLTQTFSYIGTPDLDRELGLDGSPSPMQRAWFWWVHHCGGIWYAPLVYLVIALVLVGFSRRIPSAFALIGSCLGYELSIFVLAPAADYRYSHYLILTTLLALVIVIAVRSRRGAPS
jgi:hypothetical protein